jgi:hypothetical protein
VCADSREYLSLMVSKQIQAERVWPDFGQAVVAEHQGREVFHVVRNDEPGLRYDCCSNDVGIFPLRRRLAQLLDGGNQGWSRGYIGDREGFLHFTSPILDFFDWYAHTGMEVPHPFSMDIVGPNWLERIRFGKVQK